MKKNIIAMIPARIGSERLKYKNLALINNKPLISYSIRNAKKSKLISKIYINSDHQIFKNIANKYNINFYLRPKKLGSSKVLSDDVVLDFINKFKSDIIVWVNPITPLLNFEEIDQCLSFFIKNNLNSLITVNNLQKHFYYKNKPVNFKLNSKFNKTQDLISLQQFVYSLMVWKTSSFKKFYKKNGYAMIHGKFKTFEVNSESGFLVKNDFDLNLIELIIKNKNLKKRIQYDKILNLKNV